MIMRKICFLEKDTRDGKRTKPHRTKPHSDKTPLGQNPTLKTQWYIYEYIYIYILPHCIVYLYAFCIIGRIPEITE
jgi:hypothetical protein